jgi:UPF0271 protein
MGEGCGNDELLMDLISSTNIACGFHAGDRSTMQRTAEAAVERRVAIGAHPSFADRENFGRTEMFVTPRVVFDLVTDQVSALIEICNAVGGKLHHVKPHGALYNQAARDAEFAAAIAEAVQTIDKDLILYGLSGSKLIAAGENVGLPTASEAFADRTYSSDGRLTPRTQPGALITDVERAVDQVIRMVETGEVIAASGERLAVKADTICIHGDGKHAVEFARAILTGLSERGIYVAPVTR